MFFSIPNLRSSVVSEVEEPWNLKTATPPPYEGWQGRCNRVLQQSVYSARDALYGGRHVSRRPRDYGRQCAVQTTRVACDYDNPLPEKGTQFNTSKDHKPCEFMPTYLSTTSSGNGRLVWEFEKPILFSDTGHMKEFMKILAKSMRLNKWLGGLETAALTNWVKYYELGKKLASCRRYGLGALVSFGTVVLQSCGRTQV